MKFVRAHNTTSSSAPPDVTCRQKLRPRVLGFRARRGVRCLRGESGAVHRSKAEVEATPTVTARARAEALAMGRARAEVKLKLGSISLLYNAEAPVDRRQFTPRGTYPRCPGWPPFSSGVTATPTD